MSCSVSWRLQLGIVFGLCATGIASAQRTPSAGALAGFPAAGGVIKDCPRCPEVVVVPAGQFSMGSPSGETDRDDDESPQHTVTIARPFAAGKYEVTFDEWDACVTEGGCVRAADDGWGRGRRPVIRVSYEHAIGYTEWLSKKTGKRYRLLSEAEWESFRRTWDERAVLAWPQAAEARASLQAAARALPRRAAVLASVQAWAPGAAVAAEPQPSPRDR